MKKVLALLLALVMALSLVACGDNKQSDNNTTPNDGDTAAEGKTYELTMASSDATGCVIGLVGEKFVELVDEYSNGRIKINYHQDGTLGNEMENIQQIKTGEIDIAHFGDNFGSQITTGVDPTVLPFVFRSIDDVKAVYEDEVLGAAIDAAAKENGNVYLIGLQNRSPRLLTASKEINSPDDLKGLKVRVPEIESWVTIWNSMGAMCTVVSWSETYSALQTGVVDAQENPIDNICTNKIYEVNKYIMETEHLQGVHHWCINCDTFDAMDPADQEILVKALAEADAWGDQELANLVETYHQTAIDAGATFVTVDKAAFAAAAQDGINQALQSYTKEAQDYVAAYMAG